MEIDLIFKIAGVGIIIAILNMFLTQAKREELAQVLGLAGIILVLLWLIPLIGQLFDRVESVFRWW